MNTDTPSSIASFCPSPEVVTSADEDVIKSRIFTIRGVQVMLDRDLAHLYGVETRVLNQAVKRNTDRFPAHFLFQLTKDEWEHLKSQTVTSSWGGDRGLPYTFTEQGVAMLSSVLRSPTAVKVSIQIMDVFVKMRKALASVAPLLSRIDTLERRQIADQSRNDERFDTIFKAMDGGEFPPQKVFFGASLKDLGRQYCAVTTMDAMFIPSILQRI